MEIYGDITIRDVIGYKCDTCGEELITKFSGIPITIRFGYGHTLDGEEYHFDNWKCLLQFILYEMKKENPINKDLEFGKGEKNA